MTPTPQPTNSIERIIADMTQPHEGLPHGVPASVDWSRAPRLGMGNNPGEFRAITAWGQLYEDTQGNPAGNTRVQLRNMRLFVLSKASGMWVRVQSSKLVEGAAYVEDFAGDVSKAPAVRYEPDGTLSVQAGGGYNYHFWPTSGRAEIDPHDIGGVFSTIQARLILDDVEKEDDRAEARYILSMGADYWLSLGAQWDQWKTNGDVAIGRFSYVTSEWQPFNMTSLNADELRANPPPLE
jgi:hypothetical protein